jgi:uncharacterized protein (UPF0248 family)
MQVVDLSAMVYLNETAERLRIIEHNKIFAHITLPSSFFLAAEVSIPVHRIVAYRQGSKD